MLGAIQQKVLNKLKRGLSLTLGVPLVYIGEGQPATLSGLGFEPKGGSTQTDTTNPY